MNLLAWTPVVPRHQRRVILGAVERILERFLPPIEDEPKGRLSDALAVLLSTIEGSAISTPR
jgi:hypothetical protein